MSGSMARDSPPTVNHYTHKIFRCSNRNNRLLFTILSSEVLDPRRAWFCFLFLLTYYVPISLWEQAIALVREHCNSTQMLPEVILHHCRPPTSSSHDTLSHQKHWRYSCQYLASTPYEVEECTGQCEKKYSVQ